jgi:Na+-translocating ferredoxin:NAD+ oxidoreductase RNF subunit RnfB
LEKEDVYLELIKRLNYQNPDSQYLLRIMQKLLSPDDCRLVLNLPADPAVLAEKTGLDEGTVSSKLKELTEKGVTVSTSKGPRFVREVMQLHDGTLSSSEKWVDTELLDLWKAFYEAEWMANLGTNATEPYMRVVPAWKSIERSPDISPNELQTEDNIRELVRRAKVLAVCPCSCRRSMRSCDANVETCVQFDRGAEYGVSRGAARRIDAEEAIAILDRAEETGLVHQWPFYKPSTPPNSMCNCCGDCCVIIAPGMKYGTIDRIVYKSGLRAKVDPDLCNGCQECVDRCLFDAIEMKKSPESKKLKAVVDEGKCFGCGLCVAGCETGAATMKLSES